MRKLSAAEELGVAGGIWDAGWAGEEVVSHGSRFGFFGPTFFNFAFEVPIPWDFVDGGSGGGGGEEMVSNNFIAEWASMMGPDGVAPSERAEYFSKWFEKATTNELTTLKGVIDSFKITLIELKVPVLGQLIGHLMGMSNNLRDAISGVAPRSNCGWSFGIDVSNAYADAPNALMSYAGWKAIMNLWPSHSPGNI
jgi:hypothetical protein